MSRSILKNRPFRAVFNDATEIPITGAHQDYSSHPALTILYSTNVRRFFHEVGPDQEKSTTLCKKQQEDAVFHSDKCLASRPVTGHPIQSLTGMVLNTTKHL